MVQCVKCSRTTKTTTTTAVTLFAWTTALLVLATIVGAGGAVQASAGGGVTGAASIAMTAGRMAPCAHLGDETNDVSARAYASDVVFEGKVRSKGPVRPGAGTYGVTFVVQRVHKDAMQAVTYEGLRAGSPVRLYFREKRGGRGDAQRRPPRRPDAQCVQRFAPAAGGQTVEANIKRGAKYLVFVAGVGPHNLSVLGEPVLRTPKNVDAVRKVLCRNCSEYIYICRIVILQRALVLYLYVVKYNNVIRGFFFFFILLLLTPPRPAPETFARGTRPNRLFSDGPCDAVSLPLSLSLSRSPPRTTRFLSPSATLSSHRRVPLAPCPRRRDNNMSQ